VHERVERARLAPERREDGADVRVGADVALVEERVGQRGGQLLDVLLDALALVGERQPHPRRRQRLGDGPRDRALVGDAEHDAGLSVEQSHGSRVYSATGRSIPLV
jgi:hypothetical protein